MPASCLDMYVDIGRVFFGFGGRGAAIL